MVSRIAIAVLGLGLFTQVVVPQEGQYTFAGQRITLRETQHVPITATAFRGRFELAEVPVQVLLVIEVDDQFNVYVNGTLAGGIETFTDGKARVYRIGDLLKPGPNVVAVEAYSALDQMHLALDVRAGAFDGEALLSSGPTFRASLCPAPPELGWTLPGFDDSAWASAGIFQPTDARPLGAAPRPVQAFRFPPESYLPTLIPPDYPFAGQWIQPVPTPGPGDEGAMWASFECAKGKYERVMLFVTGDDRYMLYINGHQLGWDWSPVSWNCGEVFDITGDLIDGANLVTIRLRNDLAPFCAALCEVWGINGGTGFTDGTRDLLLASGPTWDSMKGNLYKDRADITKAQALGKPPMQPWFTLKAIPCRLMPTADTVKP